MDWNDVFDRTAWNPIENTFQHNQTPQSPQSPYSNMVTMGSNNSHDFPPDDFTYGPEYNLFSVFGNPLMNCYGVSDGTEGLNSTFQHNHTPQSNMDTMGSNNSHDFPPDDFTYSPEYNLSSVPEDLLMNCYGVSDGTKGLNLTFDLTNVPNVLPITLFSTSQPINHFYSNEPPYPSHEQVVNPGLHAERDMMESWPNQSPSLVNQYQSPLWPTSEGRGSNPETLTSNSDSNFFKDNGLTTYFDIYTPESSAETHSPSTTASTHRGSKSQLPNNQRQNSRKDHKLSRKRRTSATALVPMPIRCRACKASRIACVGPPGCKRCRLKCIPGQMYTTINLSEVLNFDKWLIKEYERKRVYLPTHYLREVKVAFLQHHVNGPELKVECYYFDPDPTDPSQTTIYWKEECWKKAQTTAVSLTNLRYDLEPYVEQMVDIILDEACNEPYHIAKLFKDIRRFRESPVMSLSLKLFAVVRLLKKGWFISESRTHPKEILGNSVLYAEKSPWHAKIPAPSTVQRQLDRMLELLAAKWEPVVYKGWQKIMEKQGKQGWLDMFYVGFLIVHILEQDAQRLKIHCEERNSMNDWKHPVEPKILVEKAIHFLNTFLTHFRGISGMKHPLRLEWLPEDTKRLAKGNKDIIKTVESLQEYRINLKAQNLIGRKPCDTYKVGDEKSFYFTWSSHVLLLEDGCMIKMEDYLGKI